MPTAWGVGRRWERGNFRTQRAHALPGNTRPRQPAPGQAGRGVCEITTAFAH